MAEPVGTRSLETCCKDISHTEKGGSHESSCAKNFEHKFSSSQIGQLLNMNSEVKTKMATAVKDVATGNDAKAKEVDVAKRSFKAKMLVESLLHGHQTYFVVTT